MLLLAEQRKMARERFGKYKDAASVYRVKDPTHLGYGAHPVFADPKLGFVCLDWETGAVLATHLNRNKCAELARAAVMDRVSREKGGDLGKPVLGLDKNWKRRPGTGPWIPGVLEDVQLSAWRRGMDVMYVVRTSDGQLLVTGSVLRGGRPAADKLNRLEWAYYASGLARDKACEALTSARAALGDE